MQNYQSQLQTETLQTVKQVTTNIIERVCRQMFYSTSQTSKIFQSIVENKNDVQRIVREKHFLNSLYSSKVSYEEPRISPTRMISPLKNKEDKQEMEQLNQKAKMFVNKIRNRKKQLQGKFYLLKRAEAEKKKQIQRKRQVEAQIQKQLQRKIRRLKAQKNIEFFNEKKMVSLRQNSSYSPSRRKLSQITQSIYQENYIQKIRLPPISPSKLQQIKQQQTGDNEPIGLKKTVRKKSIKKRANTQLSSRPESPINEVTELKLFNINKTNNRSLIRQSTVSNSESQYNQDKKSYLMKRRKTQDISSYLQKHTNIGELLGPQKHFSQRYNRSIKSIKQKNKKYLTKSSLYYSHQLDRQPTIKFGQEYFQQQQQQQIFQRQ